jgi:hypothetical protein
VPLPRAFVTQDCCIVRIKAGSASRSGMEMFVYYRHGNVRWPFRGLLLTDF